MGTCDSSLAAIAFDICIVYLIFSYNTSAPLASRPGYS